MQPVDLAEQPLQDAARAAGRSQAVASLSKALWLDGCRFGRGRGEACNPTAVRHTLRLELVQLQHHQAEPTLCSLYNEDILGLLVIELWCQPLAGYAFAGW